MSDTPTVHDAAEGQKPSTSSDCRHDSTAAEYPLVQSKFVLPFSWKPVRRELSSASISGIGPAESAWHQIPPSRLPRIAARKKYFTDETLDVLFRRARWFEARSSPDASQALSLDYELQCKDGRKVTVKETAELVLFEYPSDICSTAQPENEDSDILLTGLLVRTLAFPASTPFACVLEINELLRYINERWKETSERQWFKDEYPRLLKKKPLPDEKHPEFGGDWIANNISPDRIGSRGFLVHWDSWLALPVAGGAHSTNCSCLKPSGPSVISHRFSREVQSFSLMPESWLMNARLRVDGMHQSTADWVCHADDRAFTWTHYCSAEKAWSEQVKSWPSNAKEDIENAWVRLLNVDKGLLQPGDKPASDFERNWARDFTYRRWESMGTRFGFTPHSGALLVTDFSGFPLHEHFDHEYFDQMLLLLYVRTTLRRFSRQLSEVSALRRDSKRTDSEADAELGSRFTEIRRNFMIFTNLYRFPHLSNQQQSIEMYKYMIKGAEIQELYQEIQTEINSSDDFLGAIAQGIETSKTTSLTIFASVGLCFALILEGWGESGSKIAASILFVFLLLLAVPLCHPLLNKWLSPRSKATRHQR